MIGLDVMAPPDAVRERIAFVEGDVRSPDLTRLVRAAAPDAIVHNDVRQFAEPGRSSRTIHDVNVVGTLQLLAACGGEPGLRTLVVRGSAAIYGAEASAPAFVTEDDAGRGPLRTRFQRDLSELERLFATFARRHAAVTCTMLRLQPVLGLGSDTPITRMLKAPVIPTVLGFDPRMQFISEDDSVAALAAAVRRPVRGAVNVAGAGTVSLQRMLRRLRRASLPIPHPLYARTARALGAPVTEDMVRYLRYGRGVDTTRMEQEMGFTPRLSTEDVVEAVARA